MGGGGGGGAGEEGAQEVERLTDSGQHCCWDRGCRSLTWNTPPPPPLPVSHACVGTRQLFLVNALMGPGGSVTLCGLPEVDHGFCLGSRSLRCMSQILWSCEESRRV